MDSPLRILFVAEPEAGVQALGAVRQGGPVEAQLAPTADVLRRTLIEPDAAMVWDAVVFVPGGPIEDVEVAVFVPDGVALIVVDDEVPLLLSETAAVAVPPDALGTLHARLAAPAAAPAGEEDWGLAAPDLATADDPVLLVPTSTSPVHAAATAPTEALASNEASEPREASARAETEDTEPVAPLDASAVHALGDVSHLASLADHLSVGLYRSTPEGRILYANPALAHLLGAPSVDALAHLDVRTDLGYPRDAFADEIRQTGRVHNLVVSWRRPNGDRVHTRENARVIQDASGRVLYYEGSMEDVTAEVEAQHEERAVARQHRAIVAFAAAAAEATEPDAIYLATATALLEATGASWTCLVVREDDRNQIVATAGDPPASLVPVFENSEALARHLVPGHPLAVTSPVELDAPHEVIEALLQAGVGAAGLAPVVRGDAVIGGLAWGAAEGEAIRPTDVRGAEALAWHVGGHLHRAQALGDLRDTEATLAAIADRSPHVLYRLRYTDDGAEFDYLSPGIESLTGYGRDEMEARGGLDALIVHREVLDGEGLSRHPVPGAARYHARYRLAAAHGERWVENDACPWLDGAGQPVGLVGVLQDVTDRKLREDHLADAAQTALIRQRALVDLSHLTGTDAFGAPAAAVAAATLAAADVSFWVCPPGGRCRALYAPPVVDDTTGFDGAFEPVLQHLDLYRALAVTDVQADDRVDEMGLGAFARAFGLRSVLVAPIRRDGRIAGVVAVHHHQPHEWDASETEFAGALADAIALALEREDREQAVRALDESQQRYRVLAEMASDYALAVAERDGAFHDLRWATGACARVTGYTVDELASPDVLTTLLHPDSADTMAEMARRWRRDGEAHGEIRVVTRNGDTRWLEHHVRVGPTLPDGAVLVYHAGQDVTARKLSEAALVEARTEAEAGRAAAERLNTLKSSFLANMSHEIRTPLTGILGFADLLSIEVDEAQKPFVHHIEANGRRLLDTLNAVLDLSQLEAGEYHATLAPTSLADAVAEAADRLRPLAAVKGLRFDVEADPDVAAVVDAAALGQIAGHLIGNAVKFTDAGGVLVTVEGTPDQAVVRVSDTGIGISQAFEPYVFEPFRQEETGHARSHEGSGLGLAVVRRLVQLLGGDIEVASRQPGGTVVTVSFPRVQVLEPREPAADRPVAGDGLAATAEAVAVRPAVTATAVPASADTPLEDLLGAPFDFTFLTASPDAPLDPPPDMFDFRFGRAASDETPPADPPTPPAFAAPAAPAPPPAAPPPAAPPPAAPSPAPPPTPAAPPSRPEATGEVPRDADPVMIIRARPDGPTIPEASAAGPPEEAEVTLEPGDGRPSILVVEDNDDTRMLLDRILRTTYDVTAVGDARSALLAMNQRRFSGLVLDINLGGKETGADVLRIARSLPDYGSVFAIALTAYALPGDRERLLESGFDEYISKPFTRASLMETLSAGIQV